MSTNEERFTGLKSQAEAYELGRRDERVACGELIVSLKLKMIDEICALFRRRAQWMREENAKGGSIPEERIMEVEYFETVIRRELTPRSLGGTG